MGVFFTQNTIESAPDIEDEPSNESGGILNGISEFFSSIFDWFSRIFDSILDIAKSIANIPTLILDGLKDLIEFVFNLPGLILDGLKELFIPDAKDIQKTIDNISSDFREKLGLEVVDFSSIFSQTEMYSEGGGNVDGTITVDGMGTISATFLEISYLLDVVDYVRPYVRAFVVLLLFFYNLNQFFSFIGVGRISSDDEG